MSSPPHAHRYRRSMLAAAFFFAGPGVAYGLFVSRLPALREHTGADDADLGLALLMMGLASLAALFLSQSVISRCGSHRLLAPLMVLMAAILLALGRSSSVTGLTACCAALGFCIALMDVAINTQGIIIEQVFSTRSMSRLHASYNLGGICGALLASLGASLAWSPLLNFALVMIAYCAAACPVSRGLIPDHAAAEAQPQDAQPRRRGCLAMPGIIYLCGLLTMGGYMAEGSVGEWGSLLLYAYKGAGEAVAALVYGTFSVACVLSRLSADWLRGRLREDLMVAGCSAAAAVSLAAAVCLESPAAALACYALLGLCLGPVVPILFSLAGTARGVSAAEASSFVGVMAYSGLLLFPPAIGYAAEYAGLDRALLIPVAVCALMTAGSLQLRGLMQAASRRQDGGSRPGTHA